MRGLVKELNPKEIMLENILAVMSGHTFGRNMAAEIVGGVGKLMSLIAEGKIEADKPAAARNGKWRCNAAQVLMHCKNMRGNNKKQGGYERKNH